MAVARKSMAFISNLTPNTIMGLYNPEDAEPLTTWLVKNLDAISDAEPTALAKYILELLTMWTSDPESELRTRLIDLLVDFLQKETSPFVDRLLATLRSKSFLPYLTTSEPPSQNQTPRQPRGRKRGLEQDERDKAHERDIRGPPKGPRLQFERQTRRQLPDGPRSRSQRRDEREDGPSRDSSSHQSRRDMRPDGPSGPPTAPRAALQKERCRDYYEYGFCNRGPSCPYSHGEDAMIAGGVPNGMPNGMPFAPPIPPVVALQMLNGLFPPGWQAGFMGGPSGAYDPHHAQFGPLMQNPVSNGPYDSGIQDLTPRGPRNSRPPRPQNGAHNNSVQMRGDDVPMMDDPPMNIPENGAGQMDRNNFRDMGQSRGGRGFGGRGGHGGRPERTHRSNVVDPNALTLVVEKLPPEKTNMSDLSTYFGKFGTVTNVGIDSRGNRALVSFSTHQEAHAAWKSEEAVFGNRFVVIFWHRPAPGGGAAGQKALEASVGALQKLNSAASGETGDVDMAAGDATSKSSKPRLNGHASSDPTDTDSVMEVATPKKSEPKTPQEIFEYAQRVWLEKMKGAMDVIQSTTATEAEKYEAKTKFKVLKSQKPQPPTTLAANASTLKSNGVPDGKDAKDKLDLDLDMLASGQGQSLTQEEAQQALARLQELAAERGLDPDGLDNEGSASGHAAGSYRGSSRARGWRGGYRGRGRGRGGAMALASASLDNRTKEILLQGYEKSGITDDVALDMVQSFYLPTGQAEEVHKAEPAGVAIKFANRVAAETALRSGAPSIEGLGKLSVRWYNPPSTLGKSGVDTAIDGVYQTVNGDKDSIPTESGGWTAKRPVRGALDDVDEGWDVEDDEDGGGRRRR